MKPSVPNLSETGVSKDFRLAYGNLSNFLEQIEENEPARTRFLARRAFLHRKIPNYETYFSPDNYSNVVNDENRELIEKINEIVGKINLLREQGIIEYNKLAPLRNELHKIVSSNSS